MTADYIQLVGPVISPRFAIAFVSETCASLREPPTSATFFRSTSHVDGGKTYICVEGWKIPPEDQGEILTFDQAKQAAGWFE